MSIFKKIVACISFALLLFFSGSKVNAEELIAINSKNFPDAIFREYVKSFDQNKDQYLDKSDISEAQEFHLMYKEVVNLKGVEFFTNLRILNLSDTPLTSLDITKNNKLEKFYAYNVKLQHVDFSGNPNLYYLYCPTAMFTHLDLSNNHQLQRVVADGNVYRVLAEYQDTRELAGFDISRASNWTNATISGTMVTFQDITKPITYTYDMGLGWTNTFSWKYKNPNPPPLKEQVINIASHFEKTVGDPPFYLGATTNGDGQFTYIMKNQFIAYVENSGKVQITGAGTVTIPIRLSQTEAYLAAEKIITLTVKKKSASITAPGSFTKNYGDKAFALQAKTNSDGKLTYASSNTKVATVSSNGTIAIVGGGSTNITVRSAATKQFDSAVKVIPITVRTKTASLSGIPSSLSKTYGDKPFTIKGKVSSGGKITYASGNKKIFTIDSRGKITLKGCGKTTLTVTADAFKGYSKVSKKITFTVKPKKTTITVSTKSKKILVSWKKNSGAKGYEVQYALNKKFTGSKKIDLKKSSATSTSFSSKKGRTYSVRIRAYVLNGKSKIYSSYSNVRTIKSK